MDLDWKRSNPLACPHCGQDCDAHADPTVSDTPAVPSEGALALCFACGGLSHYESIKDGLRLVKATESEEKLASVDETAVRARKMISFTNSPKLATALVSMDR